MTLLERLIAALNAPGEIEVEDERHISGSDGHRDAAVLIPITRRAQPGVILTQRPEWLNSHPGQVAFPGGKIDDEDTDAVAAALREAEEELALPPQKVEIIGAADTYYSGSGFAIAPIVGLIPPDLDLVPAPGEVQDWFEVPLDFLLEPSNAKKRQAVWQGQNRQYYDMQWQDRRIWGVTAGIIANLVRRVEQL